MDNTKRKKKSTKKAFVVNLTRKKYSCPKESSYMLSLLP